MSAKREMWVDYTKLFACILVVVGHLLQGLNQAGIVWNNTLYAYINELIYSFHMPLFMCLSGYLYGKYTKISSKEDYKHFICKKLVNLGIPYITFYSLTVFISMIFSSSVNNPKGISDILNMFIKPISPYWFIYVLLAIFIIVPVIEKIFKEKYILILLSFLIFHIANILLGGFNIYIINKLAEYLVYFYIGINIVQISEKCKCNSVLLLVIFFSLDMLVSYLNINNILNTTLISISKTIVALISLLTFVSLFHRSEDVKEENYLKSNNTKWLKLKEQMYASGGGLSKYTLSIFLMHTIFSAGVRIVLLKLGITNFYIHFVVGLFFGIYGPIIVEKVLSQTKYLEIIIHPSKVINKAK